MASTMNEEMTEAFHDMLAALKQCTSRADADLKKHFRDRTEACARDYEQCIDAISKAETALSSLSPPEPRT